MVGEWQLVNLSSEEEVNGWVEFSGSRAQKSIHNRLWTRILRNRVAFENASSPDEMVRLNRENNILKELVATIHEKDPDSIRRVYKEV